PTQPWARTVARPRLGCRARRGDADSTVVRQGAPTQPCARSEAGSGAGLAPAVQPAQARAGVAVRPVLAAHPAVVAERIEQREQVGVMELAPVGLLPIRHARDLHMADAGEVA